MCRSVLVLLIGLSGCAASQARNYPVGAGGSVADPDRSAGTSWHDTGSPAGAVDTIGNIDVPRPPPPVARYNLLPSDRRLIAGPITTIDPEAVRLLQRVLTVRGYFHGRIDGVYDPSLNAAVSSYQADVGLPITGRLDAATAQSLGISLPLPPRHG